MTTVRSGLACARPSDDTQIDARPSTGTKIDHEDLFGNTVDQIVQHRHRLDPAVA